MALDLSQWLEPKLAHDSGRVSLERLCDYPKRAGGNERRGRVGPKHQRRKCHDIKDVAYKAELKPTCLRDPST